jgi:hypothetical protein
MNKQEFAKVVQVWADGQEVEFRYLGSQSHGEWITEEDAPQWDSELEYRIKPKDVIEYRYTEARFDRDDWYPSSCPFSNSKLKITYTNGKLTNAEVIK